MRSRMNVMPITSPEQLAALTGWLASFDHKPAVPIGKYHVFTKGERVLALTQQIQLNALFPAVNPHVVTPRETVEIVQHFHAWSVNTDGGQVVAVPVSSHMHEKMESLGYRPKCVLY